MSRDDSPPEQLAVGNDRTSGSLSSEQREELAAMVATERRRAQRVRRAMIWSWIAAAAFMLLLWVGDARWPDTPAMRGTAELSAALLALAAVLSVWYYLLSRGLSLGALRAIDARLANIEAELARLSAQRPRPAEKREE